MPVISSIPTTDFVSNATTSSKEDVTGCLFPVGANRVVKFEITGVVSVAASTTGVQFGLDTPASANLYLEQHTLNSLTVGTDALATGGTGTDDAVIAMTDTAASGVMFRVWGRVMTSAAGGTCQLRIDTDAAAAATVKKNSVEILYRDMGAV